uniref:Uncharacterized protein n=1 Tax=Rhizobium phage IG49 TaxID=3129228 RepID=A0AAU8HYU2_9CAUD
MCHISDGTDCVLACLYQLQESILFSMDGKLKTSISFERIDEFILDSFRISVDSVRNHIAILDKDASDFRPIILGEPGEFPCHVDVDFRVLHGLRSSSLDFERSRVESDMRRLLIEQVSSNSVLIFAVLTHHLSFRLVAIEPGNHRRLCSHAKLFEKPFGLFNLLIIVCARIEPHFHVARPFISALLESILRLERRVPGINIPGLRVTLRHDLSEVVVGSQEMEECPAVFESIVVTEVIVLQVCHQDSERTRRDIVFLAKVQIGIRATPDDVGSIVLVGELAIELSIVSDSDFGAVEDVIEGLFGDLLSSNSIDIDPCQSCDQLRDFDRRFVVKLIGFDDVSDFHLVVEAKLDKPERKDFVDFWIEASRFEIDGYTDIISLLILARENSRHLRENTAIAFLLSDYPTSTNEHFNSFQFDKRYGHDVDREVRMDHK